MATYLLRGFREPASPQKHHYTGYETDGGAGADCAI
jgi:hypothetical protein